MIFAKLKDAADYCGIHPRLDRVIDCLNEEFLNKVGTQTQKLEDDPADHRGILSWFAQPRDRTLHEAGSYGWLVEAPIPADVLAKGKEGKVTIRLETEKGGLAVYGANFGRYPLDPSLAYE